MKKSKLGIIIAISVIVAIILATVITVLVLNGNKKPEPEHTHSWGEWTTVKDASCSADGEQKRVCRCTESETQKLDKLAHTEVIDYAVTPTCTETGLTDGKHCSVCGEVIAAQESVPTLGHTYDDKYDTSCNVCGYERDAECAHKNTTIIPAIDATCTKTGLTEGKKCNDCEDIIIPQTTTAALDHDRINHATKTPTCTEVGWDAYETCSRCDYTTYVEKPFVHDIVNHDAKAPTCTEIGWDAYETCSRCDYSTYAEKPALNHDFAKQTATDDYLKTVANCANLAVYYKSCIRCGLSSKGQAGEAMFTSGSVNSENHTGNIVNGGTKEAHTKYDCCGSAASSMHNYTIDSEIQYKEATCTEAKQNYKKCSCGYNPNSASYVVSVGNALGHDFTKQNATNNYLKTAATCQNVAVYYKSCTNCGFSSKGQAGEVMFEYGGLGNHVYDNGNDATCNVCGETKPGLYDAYDNLIASWQDLTETYGMDVSKDYPSTAYFNGKNSPCYILNNNASLANGTKIVISNSVTKIGNFAFYMCDRLTSVIIPDSVTSIGSKSFFGCSSLRSLTIPDSVTSIGDSAFWNCDSLMSVTVPGGVTSLENSVFAYCGSLKSVTICNGVTSIGTNAFVCCENLTTITIPSSVTSIGSSVFGGCSSLTTIRFQGTTSQWEYISKAYDWKSKTGNYTVCCINGNISKEDS